MLAESSDALSASVARLPRRPPRSGEPWVPGEFAHGAPHEEAALMHLKKLCVKKMIGIFSIE